MNYTRMSLLLGSSYNKLGKYAAGRQSHKHTTDDQSLCDRIFSYSGTW